MFARPLRVVPFVFLMLAGCGSSQRAAGPAAIVGPARISWSQVHGATSYSLLFYHLVHPSGTPRPPSACTAKPLPKSCARLEQQVLARLIQENVVVMYAGRRHLVLSGRDRARISDELTAIRWNPATSSLVGKRGVGLPFMRSILERQLLVQKAEAAIAGQKARFGLAFHLRKYVIPRGSRAADRKTYTAALRLATDGSPIPPMTGIHDEWVAPFRLNGELRAAVGAARAGDYLGPYTSASDYLVVQYLGHSYHALGQPARDALESKTFRAWMQKELRRIRPTCFSEQGNPAPCPAT